MVQVSKAVSVGTNFIKISVQVSEFAIFLSFSFQPVIYNFHVSSYLYRASLTIKTLHYPTDAQIYKYNAYIQL